MPKIQKRALWGLSPAEVDQLIEELQKAHEERRQQLQRRLEELTQSNEQMRAETVRMKQEMEGSEALDQELASLLLQAHVEQTRAVFERQEEVQRLELRNAEVQEISQLHREAVANQMLDKLRGIESMLKSSSEGGAAWMIGRG